MHAVLIADVEKCLDGTFAATLAVVDVVGQTHVAPAGLQAMRHEKQYFFTGISFVLSTNEFVVHLDEGMTNILLGDANETPKQCHERKKNLDCQPTHAFGEKHRPT